MSQQQNGVMKKRKNDISTQHDRVSVIEQNEEGFWFNTREGVQFGPYLTREQALLSRAIFIYQVTGDPALKPDLPEHQSWLLEVEETTLEAVREA